MRNLKKLLALVLAVMMTLSVVVFSASAADDADYTEAAQHLASLQVMKGNEKGDLMLDAGVTRYQAALFFVQALTGKTDVSVWNADKKSANFTDVPEYGTAIDYAYGLGIVKGRGNGEYGYNDAITYQDMLVMAVRALGYETADMSYPYGYILAAQKLGLTENVDQVNYKAALTRGETAQIIWDMLQTEIAVIDPLTDKVLYPGEKGLTDAITDANTERVTLLQDSGLAGGKVSGVIVDFVEADADDEESFDVVTVTIDGTDYDFAAADFGIDAETRFVNYMGLPVEIYISVDEEDLTQEAYDDGDAEVVFASFPEYTAVVNLGDAGNIKYVANDDKSYYSFGGVKFTEAKYDVEVYTFAADTWAVDESVALDEIFEYETKNGYVGTEDTYAQIAYRVVDVDDEESDKDLVEVLYTPYTFGQYNVREINGVKYTVVATYEDTDSYTNLDEVTTPFVEYLVDGAQKVTVSTKNISAKKGEAASTVVVEGVAVEAGDFMFYAYNETDNVLTVAINCGTFQTGRLTAQNSTKETVKISGTNYEVGFKGNFATEWDAAFNAETNKEFISALESGKDNVEFLVVDGNVVYMAACSETTNDSKFDFAIVTTDMEIMAELLGMTETKYENALVEGLYIVDGVVKVAMMDKTTGEWVLASVETFATEWDAEEEEFANEYNVATEAKYTDLIGEDYKNADAVADFAALVENGIVAVVAEADGVYTIADNEDDFFVYGTAEDGLLFSDTSAKTNAITADDDVDAARVTLTENTVVIVVANGIAGSRVGVQAKDNSVDVAGYFYAASADLIVFVTDEDVDVADWADAKAANSDENWYITTLTTGVEVEAGETEDDPYVVTITDVYDMKAMAMVESIKVEVETLADAADYMDIETAGVILFKSASDELVIEDADFADIIVEVANDNEAENEYAIAEVVEFVDAETIVIDDVTTKAEAFDINVTVVTLNMTGLDPEDYDFDEVVSSIEWADGDEDNDYGVGDVTVKVGDDEMTVWEYALDNDLVNVINEPTEGILDQYVIDAAVEGATILVPAADSDDFADAIEVSVALYVAYDVDSIEDGVVNMIVYKVLFID